MKITTKINLLITAWLLLILLIVNTFVFFAFMKTTVDMEEQVVSRKAHIILDRHHVSESLKLNEELLDSYLSGHSFIRIVGPDSTISDEVTNDTQLNKIKPVFSKQEESELRPFDEHQNLVVRIPIYSNEKVISTLEIGERLSGLESRKDILLSIMAAVTALSVILSLLAGRWLTNIIMKPITSMISTMEEIEQSGVPKKLFIQNDAKDELHKMATTFNRMIEKLQENILKQKQFVSDASHELKTPLTVISSFAELLERRGIQNEEIAKEAAKAISSEAERMQSLTQTLLNLAELEHPEDVKVEPVNLVTLCYAVQHQLQEVYHRRIILQETSPAIFIKGNEQQLKQVIIIFLDNAIKYSSDKIEVFVESDNSKAVLRIKDYGIGIPEEELQNIFERFYRVDKARSRKTGGTGLGLSIAENIVELHSGEINIQSEENTGTDIKVTFPLLYNQSNM